MADRQLVLALGEIAEDGFNAEAAETAEILGFLCELCGLGVEIRLCGLGLLCVA